MASHQKNIESKVKEMSDTMSVEEIIRSNPKNFWIGFDEIGKIKFGGFTGTIKITKSNGEKLKYSIRDRKDFKRAKIIFEKFL